MTLTGGWAPAWAAARQLFTERGWADALTGRFLRAGFLCLWLALVLTGPIPFRAAHAQSAAAQGAEIVDLSVARREGAITVDFSLRAPLSRAVEDALQRGTSLYFVAQATVYKPRWYWRDERLGRATRTWRLTYQPLTGTYRVSLGALGQSHETLSQAMQAVTRLAQWRVTEGVNAEPDDKTYVEFSWRLDTSQLPRPLQLSIGAQADWTLAVERTLRVE